MFRTTATCLLAAVLVLSGSNQGLAAGTLTGETLAYTGSTTFNDSISCSSTVIFYTVTRGTASGPVPGRFDESGRIDISSGVVTAWTANFTIYPLTSTTALVNGTKTLAVGGAASCTSVAGFDRATAASTLNYTATFSAVAGGGSESGLSAAALNLTVGLNDTVTGIFTEIFGQRPAAGCDSTGNSQGNDDCQQ